MADATWFLIWRGSRQWMLCRNGDDGPEFHDLEIADDLTASEAAVIAEQLRELGYAGQSVVLGLPSDHCLAANIPAEKKQRDYEALLFALEEKLPVAAEDMVADFVFAKESNRALGVAVELRDIRPLIDELEHHGVSISVLCPTPFLALQDVLEELPSLRRTVCLWQQDEKVEYFLLEAGMLCEWSVLGADKGALQRQLRLAVGVSREPTEIACFALDDDALASIREPQALASGAAARNLPITAPAASAVGSEHADLDVLRQILVSPDGLLDRAAQQAHRVASGRQSALIDLRKHQLAPADAYRNVRGLLQTLTAVSLVFLIGFCAAVHWRANQYQELAASFAQRQREVFERTFPGQRVPVGIRSRLESERTKLSAVAGQSAELPKLTSELETLLALLESLPDEVRSSWDRIWLDSPGQIVLEGKVLSHADAGVIVDSLTDGGFDIEVPQTEQLPNQLVSVRIRGGRSSNASQ